MPCNPSPKVSFPNRACIGPATPLSITNWFVPSTAHVVEDFGLNIKPRSFAHGSLVELQTS